MSASTSLAGLTEEYFVRSDCDLVGLGTSSIVRSTARQKLSDVDRYRANLTEMRRSSSKRRCRAGRELLHLMPDTERYGYGSSKSLHHQLHKSALACLQVHPFLVPRQPKAGTTSWRSPSNKPTVHVDEYGILNHQDSTVRLGI